MDREESIRLCIARGVRLRGTGPATDEYLRWRDETDELVADLTGSESRARQEFRAAVGPFTTTESEGMQVTGEHGMLVRVERGVELLRALLGAAG